tara:strand:+ start:4342 stop:4767 length:426 start_codon:yes stop_codon:yes gene_type:complete
MKDYKNWTGSHRLKMYAKFKYQKSKNLLPEWLRIDGECEMCGETHKTMPHAEEYGPTFDDYLKNIHVLCVRCHSMLHLRFKYNQHWIDYLDYLTELQKGKTERKKPLGHMGVLFDKCKYWKKTKIPYKPKQRGKWWQKLQI